MLKDILLAALIIAGVLAAPILFFWLNAWFDKRRDGMLTGRQLVMEGELRQIVYGDIISTRGHRPLKYPVTCVYLADGRNCVIFGTILARFRTGTRIAVWRDRSDDRHYIERYDENEL